jgi:hypothetical protein
LRSQITFGIAVDVKLDIDVDVLLEVDTSVRGEPP